MIKKLLIALIIGSALIGTIIANRSLQAQSQGGGDSELLKKLDEITQGQKAILDELASMKEDLRIIKIRVTQIQ